jgi:hypothetical protein
MEHELTEVYGEKFFRGRKQYRWRASIVCAAIQYQFSSKLPNPIETVIDVGAATGDLVQGFLSLPFPPLEAWGIEGDPSCLPYLLCPRDRMIIQDMRKPFTHEDIGVPRVDLVTCWEVLEHVESRYVDVLTENLVGLSDKLLMSTCPPHPSGKPGKGSVGHWNEALPEYWEGQFLRHGYRRVQKQETFFRDLTLPWKHKYGVKAFWENVIYLEKKHG